MSMLAIMMIVWGVDRPAPVRRAPSEPNTATVLLKKFPAWVDKIIAALEVDADFLTI
ncbi:hypothetical protein [Duganella sp. P38]|uniref:hypothetical protein n=1 Tax=Duganella sp. P38 TaxID=3423949 RepID=UPI003D79F982